MFIDRCFDHITGHLETEVGKFLGMDIGEILFGLGQTSFVELSNVSRWIYRGEKDVWSWWDSPFPCLSPPWPFAWFEFAMPTIITAGDLVKGFSSKIKRVGIFSIENSRKDNEDVVQYATEQVLPTFKEEDRPAIEDDSVHWVTNYLVFLESHIFDNDCIYVGKINSFLDERGQELFESRGFSAEVEKVINLMDNRILWNHNLSVFVLPAYFGVSLLHCKNVEAVERKSEESINRHRKKKGKRPLIRFKTLEIDAARKILKYEGKSDKVGLRKALHICRGHFRDYREGRGLFGRYKDVYWVPMHTRGDEKVGIIEKDYKIGKMKK